MFKNVCLGLAGLVALLALVVVVKFYVLSPRLRPALDFKAQSTPAALARGKYLVDNVAGCLGCHSEVDGAISGEPPKAGRLGSGRDFGVLPGFPGRVRAPNLTPDPDTGLGRWTDGEVARAIREGVSRDGRPLFPMMPFITYGKTLNDDDTLAVIAYLRSLTAIKNDAGRTQVDFPVSMFVRAVPAPLDSPPPAEPPASDPLSRGQWLLSACSCHDCHDSVNDHREPIPGKSMAGGVPMPVAGKGIVYSANITSDAATGIASYALPDLLRVLNEGVGKAGQTLYAMPWRYYAGMTDEDKRALIQALRLTPPVVNGVLPPTFTR